MIKRHQEELRMWHQKLDMHSDTSLDRFKQTAMVHMCPCLSVSSYFLLKKLWPGDLKLTNTLMQVSVPAYTLKSHIVFVSKLYVTVTFHT